MITTDSSILLLFCRIMMLDKGRIREYDNPSVLLQDPSTMFYAMCKDAGLVSTGNNVNNVASSQQTHADLLTMTA